MKIAQGYKNCIRHFMFLGYLGQQNQSREKNISAKSGFTLKIMFGILTIQNASIHKVYILNDELHHRTHGVARNFPRICNLASFGIVTEEVDL